MPIMDISKVKEEAAKELREEREAAAKKQIKDKMKELEAAKLIVRNLERELEDLYGEITE